jgi:hypothetical protein
MLVSWAVTALVITRDIRRERRNALDELNLEYLLLCAEESAR